jgi:NAD(P) transhydrogenase subunit beta
VIYIYLYLLATILFVWGIKGLTGVRTARRGNRMASVGMLIAVVAAMSEAEVLPWWALAIGIAIGAAVGLRLAIKVPMTAMPELVAAFNGLGGAASAFVGLSYLVMVIVIKATEAGSTLVNTPDVSMSSAITVPISVIIGSATLTGSFVAYLKLGGKKIVHPLKGSARNSFHGALGIAILVLSLYLVMWAEGSVMQIGTAIVITAIAGLLGVLLVIPIGGADMPVVVALLNSYSGLAAAASGFVINNLLLVVAGALVGASGLILTKIMCKAMNRSLGNVLMGGIDDESQAEDAREYNNIKETSAEEVAMLFDGASSVIFVPGYGLAVAQAQHTVRELAEELEKRGTDVKYAIHPVAGRMPGHMNVLLAEADVPYEQLYEMDMINGDFPNADVAIILGANDVVNPIAREDSGSPIAGMPILDVDYAQTVVVVKRSLSPGYAGIKNPLFDNDNTLMLFADAKAALQGMVKEVKDL